MQILVENGSYHMMNMGDVGMLQVGLRRILDNFPSDTRIVVLTTNPERLNNICPTAVPICGRGRDAWQRKTQFSKIAQRLPDRISVVYHNFEQNLAVKSPQSVYFLKRYFTNIKQSEVAGLTEYYNAIKNADAVISTGGGLINDWFVDSSQALLDTFMIAQSLGKPTAMFGLGFGPIENSLTIDKVKIVFPKLKVLSFRESISSLPLLASLGIVQENVVVTGDDALELAYQARKQEIGKGIGFNIRISRHSQVPTESVDMVRQVLLKAAEELKAEIIPAPVSFRDSHNDLSSIKQVLGSLKADYHQAEKITIPTELIDQISECRIMITGAYHSAVYSLAQGIPVITLARSKYYQNKFAGLSHQFNGGCKMVFYDDPDFRTTLHNAIIDLWKNADQYRNQLLAVAYSQINASKDAWRSFRMGLG